MDDKDKEEQKPGDDKKEPEQQPHKEVTIIVNGQRKPVETEEISYERIVEIAFPDSPKGPNIFFTVAYRDGHPRQPEGLLAAGDSVKVNEGMVFNVTRTDKS